MPQAWEKREPWQTAAPRVTRPCGAQEDEGLGRCPAHIALLEQRRETSTPGAHRALESEEDRHAEPGSTGFGIALLSLLSFLSLLLQRFGWWFLVGHLTNLTRSRAEMDFPSPYMST